MGTYSLDRGMIQEQLETEWELLVSAILLNQSRRTAAWDETLAELFRRWPTPTALAAADDTLEGLLKPFGFNNVKSRRLRRMSEDYLTWDGQDPRKLHGIGLYGYDSWRVFVRGDRPAPEEVDDGPLSAFVSRGQWSVRKLSQGSYRRATGVVY